MAAANNIALTTSRQQFRAGPVPSDMSVSHSMASTVADIGLGLEAIFMGTGSQLLLHVDRRVLPTVMVLQDEPTLESVLTFNRGAPLEVRAALRDTSYRLMDPLPDTGGAPGRPVRSPRWWRERRLDHCGGIALLAFEILLVQITVSGMGKNDQVQVLWVHNEEEL